MDTFFDIEAQKRSQVTKLGAQTQHRVVLRLVPPSASKQSGIMCARDKCGIFHNIGKAISGSTASSRFLRVFFFKNYLGWRGQNISWKIPSGAQSEDLDRLVRSKSFFQKNIPGFICSVCV